LRERRGREEKPRVERDWRRRCIVKRERMKKGKD